jgi:hypothetical protein
MILFIIILAMIISTVILVWYFEIFRYYKANKSGWKDVIKLDKKYKYIPRVNIKGKVVISLTTIPDRIDKMGPTLCSILSQDRRVDEIRINIPFKSMKGKRYKIPKSLKHLKWVKIYRVVEDLGPSTKLLPTARSEKDNTKIIVIDDDVIYGSRFVRKIIKTFKDRKCKEAITNYGSNVNVGSGKRQWDYFRGDRYVHILFGCGGYVVTPKMLPPEVYKYNNSNDSDSDSDIPPDAVYVDDNWISGWLNLNGVKVYLMGMRQGCSYFPNLRSVGTTALSNTSNKNKKHEKVVNRWFLDKGAYRMDRMDKN